MRRFIVLTATLAVVASISPVRADDTEEVKRLKARIELLEAKLETANLKIEKLEQENNRLRKGADNLPAKDAKPKYTHLFNEGFKAAKDEAEYVLEKVTRDGRQVTIELTATLTKGAEKKTMRYFSVHAVDADGKTHKGLINAGPDGKGAPEVVDLRAGLPTKVQIRFPLEVGVTKLKTLEVTMTAVERIAIKFSNLEVPK